jgi:hypothetical protein
MTLNDSSAARAYLDIGYLSVGFSAAAMLSVNALSWRHFVGKTCLRLAIDRKRDGSFVSQCV